MNNHRADSIDSNLGDPEKEEDVAQLIVRNLDDDLVQRLKRRAAQRGHSTEEEHRQLLRAALRPGSVIDRLATMPDVGNDDDFGRSADFPRDVDLVGP
jgi:plasmid stability protein